MFVFHSCFIQKSRNASAESWNIISSNNKNLSSLSHDSGNQSIQKALDDKCNRVKSLRGQWGPVGSGYEERYKERWGKELLETVKKEFCCIAEIMLHVVTQSQAINAGTAEFDTFLIYHDGLKQ